MKPAENDPSFSVVTLNIWHNQGDWPGRLAMMLDGLRDLNPEVICLQEVLQNPELPNQAETIAEALSYAVHFTSVDSVGSPKRYGNAILTRLPVLATNERKLEPLNDYRVAAHALVQVGAQALNVYCTHLHYSGEASGDAVRGMQFRDLLSFIEATSGDAPVLIAGDFNTRPDSPDLGILHPRFADAYAATHPDRMEEPTTLNPHEGHTPRRIDFLYYERSTLRPLATEIIFDTPGPDSLWASDHFGVLGRFAFTDHRTP